MISALCRNSSSEMVQLKESYEFQPLGGNLACSDDTLKPIFSFTSFFFSHESGNFLLWALEFFDNRHQTLYLNPNGQRNPEKSSMGSLINTRMKLKRSKNTCERGRKSRGRSI